jgi:hypothetical protein
MMPPNYRLPGHLKWHMPVAIELLAERTVD